MKNNFVFYRWWFDVMENLDEKDELMLFRRICRFWFYDINEPCEKKEIEALFMIIRGQLEEDTGAELYQ